MQTNVKILSRSVVSLMLLDAYSGMLLALVATTSPFVAATYALSPSSLALLFAAAGGGGLLALFATHFIDSVGRKRVLLMACLCSYVSAPLAALSPNVYAYAGSLILVTASASTIHTACVIMMYEQLPRHLQFRGQSLLGIARAIGGGGALGWVAIAVLLDVGWRGAWAVCCYPILLHPFFSRHLQELSAFRTLSTQPGGPHSTSIGCLRVLLTRNTACLMAFTALWAMAATASAQWLYFHSTIVLRLSALQSAVLIGGAGLVSFGAFFVAERMATRHGNIRTATICCLLSMFAGLSFYAVPSAVGLLSGALLAMLLIAEFGLSNATISTLQMTINTGYPMHLLARFHGVLNLVGASFAVLGQLLLAGAINTFGSLLQAILLMVSVKVFAALALLTMNRRFHNDPHAARAAAQSKEQVNEPCP
jgi:MFS family permease